MNIETHPSKIDIHDLDILENVITSSIHTFRARITYLEDELNSCYHTIRKLRDFTISLAHDTSNYLTPTDLANAARNALGQQP